MRNKKVIILSIIGVVLVAAITVGILYFTTDLFKTEQQLFYKYLSQTKIIDNNFINQYEKANERITQNSYSSLADLNISTAIPNPETGISDVQKILTVKSNGLENTLLKQSYRDFIFSSNNQNFLTLKYLRDNNTYAITADNILAKYLAVDNTNLRELFAKLGIAGSEDLPNSIPTNYEEILKIDEVTLSKLSETYGTLIYNNIDETSFYKIANSDKTETIGVSFSQQELSNILKLLLETAKNDSILLNLIISKAQLLSYNNITIEDIQAEIQTCIEDITEGTYSTEKDFLKVSLVKKDKQVIKLQFESDCVETNGMITENTYNQETAEKVKENIEFDFSELNKITMLMKENENEIIKSTINYTYDNNNLKINVESISNLDGESNNIKMQYEINNYQSDNISQNIIVDMMINEEENYQVSLVNNITLKQDVQISKLTSDNSAKLNDMTSEELSQLFTALINRVMTLYGANLIGSTNGYNT